MVLLDPVRVAPNPFVGPRALGTGEVLYGRDREKAELTDLLIAERIVLLYSPSGAGKTSLLGAGVVPALIDEGFRVLPTIRVGQEPPTSTGARSPNRYVLSTLLSLEEGLPCDAQHRLDELAVVSVRDYLDPCLNPAEGDDDGNAPDVALIFDQFEEVLTLDPTDQGAKAAFFAQIGVALQHRRLWAVFAMREDYVPALDPYLHFVPTRFRTRCRLDLLGLDAARQAIQRPSAAAGVTFSDAAARRLVDDLRRVRVQRPDGVVEELGPHVEPVQLQVVCRRLWQQLPAGTTVVDERDLDRVGDLDHALADYYQETVAAIAAETGVSELSIRDLCEQRLITEQGFRGQVLPSSTDAGAAERRVLELLERAHLVRGETRHGAIWYELSHDRLVDPVRDSNAEWRASNLSVVQRQAALWESEHRSAGLLLTNGALDEAEAWADEHRGDLTDVDRDFLDACRQARTEAQRQQRQARRIRSLAVAAVVVGLIATALAAVAAVFSVRASREEKTSEARRLIAEAQRTVGQDLNVAIPLAIEATAKASPLGGDVANEAESVLYEVVNAGDGTRAIRPVRPVQQAAFSPDGGRLVTADAPPGTSARVWDRRTGAPLVELSGHNGSVLAATFSRDGSLVATAGLDKTARVWDARTGRQLRSFVGHRLRVWDVAFSPDGTRVATASADKTAKVWDARTGRPLHTLAGHADQVNAVAFSPDGTRLATASADKTAKVWDVRTGTTLHTFTGHRNRLWDVAFSPDGSRLATASADSTAKIWNATSGEELHTLVGHTDQVDGVAFTPDGTRLLTASRDESVRLWNASSGRPVHVFAEPHSGGALSVAVDRNGTQFLTAFRDAAPTITGVEHHGGPILSVAFSPDGRRVATGSDDHTAKVWDVDTRRLVRTLTGHAGRVTAVTFSPDGTQLATASDDFRARVWDVGTGHALRTLEGHGGRVNAVGFNRDGTVLATASDDNTAKVWDLRTKRVLHTLRHGARVNAVAFNGDGTRLATGSDDQTVIVWDARTGRELRMLPAGQSSRVNAVAFDHDGTRLATGSDDSTARVWDVGTGWQLDTLATDSGRVRSVQFDAAGRWLATAGDNGSVEVWDVSPDSPARKRLLTIDYPDSIDSAAFSPRDHALVAAGGEDARLHLSALEFDRHAPTLVQRAQSLITRTLTSEECEHYLQQKRCPRWVVGSTS